MIGAPSVGAGAAVAGGPSLELVGELGARLVLQRDLGDAVALTLDAVLRALSAERASLRLAGDAAAQPVAWAARSGDPEAAEVEAPPLDGSRTAEVLAGNPGVVGPGGAPGDGRPSEVSPPDDPLGGGGVHWVGVPVPGPGGRPVAALTAVRAAESAPFDDWDLARLRLIAHLAAPTLAGLIEERDEDRSIYREQLARGRPLHLFRRRALDEHASGGWRAGDALRVAAPWHEWVFWMLVAVFVAAAAAAVVVERPVWESVPARVLAAPPASAGGEVRVRALVPLSAGPVPIGAPARLRLAENEGRVRLTVHAATQGADPAAVARWLGPGARVEDGPYRWVEAAGRLPNGRLPLAAGAAATLEVALAEEPLLLSLFPGLRQAVRR